MKEISGPRGEKQGSADLSPPTWPGMPAQKKRKGWGFYFLRCLSRDRKHGAGDFQRGGGGRER